MSTKSLSDYFACSIFMSGTPAEYQKVITKESLHCDCPIYEAVEKKYVTKPQLNLIKCMNNQYNSALYMIYKNELDTFNKTKVEKNIEWPIHMIANCKSIDEIESLYKNCYTEFAKENNIHLISIHSDKKISNAQTQIETIIKPKLDMISDIEEIKVKYKINEWLETLSEDTRIDYTPKDMTDILDLIDKGIILKNEPVILFQVDMISEGINICSFNSSCITSKADIKSTQQIGRPIRDYVIKIDENEYHKKIDGHANIYCMIENEYEICDLLDRLENAELTDGSFDWGSKVDLINGSSTDNDTDVLPDLNTFKWEPITTVEIKEYRALFNSNKQDKDARHISSIKLSEIPEEDIINIIKLLNVKNPNNVLKNLQELKEYHKNPTSYNKSDKKKNIPNKISIQNIIDRLRKTVIHNQLEANQPHGWNEWNKMNDAFILYYLANGNNIIANSIKNVFTILKDYLHLDTNPNLLNCSD